MQPQRPSYDYVVIEGNIGSGKTTLATKLAERWGARLMLEQFNENPFLPKFYEHPERHAFALELSFLAERYHQKREELNRTDIFRPMVVSDYSFAKSLVFARINLPEDEFQLYRSLFHIIHGRLAKPGLLVYLHCSPEKSLRQIKQRGRKYEQGIDLGYLESIQQGYLDFFRQQQNTTVLILNTDGVDFVGCPEDEARMFRLLEAVTDKGVHVVNP